MKRLFGGLALVAVLVGVTAQSAAAQLHGNVVWGTKPGPGVTIYGDFATALNDDAKVGGETPTYFGGRAELGLPIFSVWAGFGSYNPGGDNAESSTSFGGGAGFNIIKGPMVPVMLTLEAGVGYMKETVVDQDYTTLNVPIGARVGINIPTPGIGIKPWITPRAHIMNEGPSGATETTVGFGVNAGLAVQLLMGLGIQASVDWMSLKPEGATEAWKPLALGVGAYFRLSVPSLGVM
jgi:hypothetical protein